MGAILLEQRRILMILTSHADLGGVRRTGFYVSEAAEPWAVFTQAGYRVDFATVAGGPAPEDGYDPDSEVQRRFRTEVDLNAAPALSEVDSSGYDAVFFAGGHGTMWDFPTSTVGSVAAAAFDGGAVVAAVCHGPAALVGATLADGLSLVDNRRVTGFSNEEEEKVGLTEVVPFSLEDALVEAGANYESATAFEEKVVVDDRLVTGQNPASAYAVAYAVVDALSRPSTTPVPERVWFITGAGAGLGKALARQALAAGERVVATARRLESLDELTATGGDSVLALPLDVTDRRSIRSAVAESLSRFGRIDVLVNNAGYGLRGATEEWDLHELREQFDTNVFGLVDVTRAVLPVMRGQRNGHVIQMSSVGGVSATLGGTAYAATKFALEGLSEGLSQEVAPFGIKVTLVEPGPFRTEFAGRSTRWSPARREYRPVLAQSIDRFRAQDGQQPNDPSLAAAAILEITRMPNPPLRLPLGPECFDRIRSVLTTRLEELDQLEPLGRDMGYEQ